jgi:hypothetical protein
MHMILTRPFSSIGLLLLIPLVGCDSKSDIEVYQVPKEVDAVTSPAGDPHAGVPMPAPGAKDPHSGLATPAPGVNNPHGGMSSSAGKPSVEGKVPASWGPGRASSMRLASYLAKGDGEAAADISLVVMGGQAGGLLPNVNRWRQQVGLDPVDQQGLEKSSQKVMTPLGEAVIVDLVAPGAVANAALDGRIIAATLSLDTEVWFYKMRGNQDVVGREKQGFLDWIASARKVKQSPSQSPPKPAPPAQTPAEEFKLPTEITWKTPKGWRKGPAKSMRMATYFVGSQSGTTGEATVVKLGGKGGGDLANVNRWRGQIGLGAISAADLAAAVVKVDSPGGSIALVDCAGADKKTLAGWLRRNGSTWFFKLTGPVGVVDAERAHFMSFLSSLNFPTK